MCSSAEARLEVAEVAGLAFSGEVLQNVGLEGGYHAYIYIYVSRARVCLFVYVRMYVCMSIYIHIYLLAHAHL